MLVHVFDDTPHHYLPMYRFFTRLKDVSFEQVFLVRSPKAGNPLSADELGLRYYQDAGDLLAQLYALPKQSKIVFHGLFDLKNICSKLLFSSLARRCSCVFWGAEIYRHTTKNKNLKQRLVQAMHLLALRRFEKVLCLNPGDAALVKKHLYCDKAGVLPYPLLSKQFSFNESNNTEMPSPLKFLVGNSAAASNEHLYALEQLKHLAGEDIEIYLPLNYGGEPEYVEQVIGRGRELFGDKVKPLVKMLKQDEYDALLAKTHIAVFAHQRQQGLYVAYAMLQTGKRLFLRRDTSSFDNLSALGFEVNQTEQLAKISIDSHRQSASRLNAENARLFESNFTEQALLPKWREFFISIVR